MYIVRLPFKPFIVLQLKKVSDYKGIHVFLSEKEKFSVLFLNSDKAEGDKDLKLQNSTFFS